jgi:hypothetical protein
MCIEGFKMAHGGSGDGAPKPPSEAQFEAMVARFADKPPEQ